MNIKHSGPITYFVQGGKPKLLLLSGTHGDEYGVIEAVKGSIRKYLSQLPEFVFIPEVSPSAVSNRTRVNNNGIDLNRSFGDSSLEPETIANMEIVKDNSFDLCVSFHEDPGISEFYFYDSGMMDESDLALIRSGVQTLGIKLYDGVDDPSDPYLANMVNGGYISSPADTLSGNDSYENWSLNKGIVKRTLTMEVPGTISMERKTALVNLLFEDLILPFFR